MGRATKEAAITAYAPATVANVAVGFDVLGFAMEDVGDRVTVTPDRATRDVTIERIDGVVRDLPLDPRRNTASAALLSLIEARQLDHGFRISILKGIPLGSGMGGSAASAVAAVVAANHLLDAPQDAQALLPHCLAGEQVASGAPHADNAAPCLFGGLTATLSGDPRRVLAIPVPADIVSVLVHPHLEIETRRARAALPGQVPLGLHVEQMMHLCGFLVGCFRGDLELVGRSMVDRIAEPARASLIPGLDVVRSAARAAGALGSGIAGSGPSVFAWVVGREAAGRVESAMKRAFLEVDLQSDSWVGPIRTRGAAVEPR